MAKHQRRKEINDLRRFFTGRGGGQSRLQLASDHTVYAQGDFADALFLIQSGWVKISTVGANGKEAVTSLRRSGDFFGSSCLLRQRRLCSVTTLTECSLVRVSTTALVRLLRGQADFAETFMISVLQQRFRAEETLIDLLTNSSEKRLARTLLHLSRTPRENGTPSALSQVNQAMLASMIGTTRSRVSFFMNEFRRRGFIEYDRFGHVSVRDSLSGVLEKS